MERLQSRFLNCNPAEDIHLRIWPTLSGLLRFRSRHIWILFSWYELKLKGERIFHSGLSDIDSDGVGLHSFAAPGGVVRGGFVWSEIGAARERQV